MRFLILLCLALSTLSAAETKLPDAAAKLVDRFDADAAKLRADAEKAVDVKAAALVKELQRVQDATMKKGDLDGANAIKATIEKLKAAVDVAAAKPEPEIDVRGAYKCTHTNDPIHEIFLKDNGQGLTGLGDKFTWTFKDGLLSFAFKDGSTSKGEYHPKAVIMTSTGKTATGEDRCNFYLEKE